MTRTNISSKSTATSSSKSTVDQTRPPLNQNRALKTLGTNRESSLDNVSLSSDDGLVEIEDIPNQTILKETNEKLDEELKNIRDKKNGLVSQQKQYENLNIFLVRVEKSIDSLKTLVKNNNIQQILQKLDNYEKLEIKSDHQKGASSNLFGKAWQQFSSTVASSLKKEDAQLVGLEDTIKRKNQDIKGNEQAITLLEEHLGEMKQKISEKVDDMCNQLQIMQSDFILSQGLQKGAPMPDNVFNVLGLMNDYKKYIGDLHTQKKLSFDEAEILDKPDI